MPLLDSALYIFAAFIFGVIFGIFVKGLTRIIFSIILAVIFLAILVSFFDGERATSMISAIIGFATLLFAFFIKTINHSKKGEKYDRYNKKVGIWRS